MSKFTPGPWLFRPTFNEITDSTFVTIAMLPTSSSISGKKRKDEIRANGQLLAAAPDLLEALKAVVAVADRKTLEFDLARAAIAKATGEADHDRE